MNASATANATDQSASEPRLHRALYVIKYLRAMVLNLVLVLAAVALFEMAGVKGLYPLADDTINALQAQAEQLRRQGDVLGSNFVVVTAVSTAVLILAFFVWMYLSITNVWRIALRFQAVFLWFSVLVMPLWAWPQVEFSLANLDPVFSGLVLAYFAFVIALVTDMAIALWGVSRSPEPSSFVATLDPRLSRSWWTYLNKLLDLPRTPFRNWRIVAAYLLSLAAAILLISALMYLLTFGVVQNKLAQLVSSCTAQAMAECSAQSSAWARQIIVGLAVALVGLQVAGSMQAAAKRLGGLSVSDVLRRADDRFILYLRPFDTDDVVLPKPKLPILSQFLSFRPFPVRIEEEFFDVADGYLPLIAVGRPGESGSMGGLAHRAYYEESEWQRNVLDRIQRADRIVMVLEDTKGVNWEISKVLAEGAATKTLFLFDPGSKDPHLWRTLADKMLPQFAAAGLLPSGFTSQERPIAFHFRNGDAVEIVNRNWTATSYRTAFSSFLAERAG
jgi:hypothetical protein